MTFLACHRCSSGLRVCRASSPVCSCCRAFVIEVSWDVRSLRQTGLVVSLARQSECRKQRDRAEFRLHCSQFYDCSGLSEVLLPKEEDQPMMQLPSSEQVLLFEVCRHRASEQASDFQITPRPARWCTLKAPVSAADRAGRQKSPMARQRA